MLFRRGTASRISVFGSEKGLLVDDRMRITTAQKEDKLCLKIRQVLLPTVSEDSILFVFLKLQAMRCDSYADLGSSTQTSSIERFTS